MLNYKSGFIKLMNFIRQNYPERVVELATLEERFWSNANSERILGTSQETTRQHNEIIHSLNKLSIEVCTITFSDLCLRADINLSKALTGSIVENTSATYGKGKKWGILVGVNCYEDDLNYGTLKVCVQDAHALQKQLIKGGFANDHIIMMTDQTVESPTRRNILTNLQSLADATDEDDLLLFYYSGHGDEMRNEPFLVARDGHRLDLVDTAIPISRVREIMQGANARAKVLILDACHSGANFHGKGPKRMSEDFINRVFEQAEGLAILASCKQNELSYEWRQNRRSVFTHYLLDGLSGNADHDEKSFVTIQDVHRHVSNGVRLWAANHKVSQTPTFECKTAGDIILVNSGRV